MKQLQSDLKKFAEERKWGRYHTPKNLSMALIVECAELVEIFQWMDPVESCIPNEGTLNAIKDEIGDVQIYLLMIAEKFDLCPIEMAKRKLKKNKIKHPVSGNRFNKFS